MNAVRPITRIYPFHINMGCDPELFLSQGEVVIGSEKVIPKAGIYSSHNSGAVSAVVRDGVQVELQPRASTCREGLIANLAWAFHQLRNQLDGATTPNMTSVVEVSEAELASLSDASRILGCAPSRNANNPSASINVNPATYQMRSAGGHLHFGLTSWPDVMANGVRDSFVPLLDILLGNTCVMLEDPDQARERRKVYGRAGEYRLPAHGLEYRTLSNFWLKSPILASFVLGLGRFAVWVGMAEKMNSRQNVYDQNQNPVYVMTGIPGIVKDLMDCVDIRQVIRAINEGDQDQAMMNWLALRPFFAAYCPEPFWTRDFANPVVSSTFNTTTWFLSQGSEYWFPGDGFNRWIELDTNEHFGWERFLRYVVGHDLMARSTERNARLLIQDAA